MAIIRTEIELNDFDNDDIVDHVVYLIESDSLKSQNIKKIEDAMTLQEKNSHSIKVVTTQDQMKFDLLKKHFEEFDFEELQDRLTVDLEELRSASDL